ncbi:SDR family oxidoreductase [Streptomyces sp. NBRC 110028]|uniref:SDR family oxidoreductase n=1 Tax=Streptomyces sp. NBRC 110028 TaxID=1621260 RepID=UPI0006E21282|nr:SDR family oxidoreductase [Streptomyces sp. NBRC 110028]
MNQHEQRHPVERQPQPEFPQQDQAHPGETEPMEPRPDHGEDSYEGHGLLENRRTVITGGQGLAGNLAERGARVNAVAPGPMWTPLIPATLPDTSEFGAQRPLNRPAQPAEMAPAYVFLASQQAGYITAEIVNATGGTPLP